MLQFSQFAFIMSWSEEWPALVRRHHRPLICSTLQRPSEDNYMRKYLSPFLVVVDTRGVLAVSGDVNSTFRERWDVACQSPLRAAFLLALLPNNTARALLSLSKPLSKARKLMIDCAALPSTQHLRSGCEQLLFSLPTFLRGASMRQFVISSFIHAQAINQKKPKQKGSLASNRVFGVFLVFLDFCSDDLGL